MSCENVSVLVCWCLTFTSFLFLCQDTCGPTSQCAYVYIAICVIFAANPLSHAVNRHHDHREIKENGTISKAHGRWESLSFPGLPWRTCGVTPSHTHTHTPALTLNYSAPVTTNQSNYHCCLCAGAASALLVTLALKCMRASAILSLLFI